MRWDEVGRLPLGQSSYLRCDRPRRWVELCRVVAEMLNGRQASTITSTLYMISPMSCSWPTRTCSRRRSLNRKAACGIYLPCTSPSSTRYGCVGPYSLRTMRSHAVACSLANVTWWSKGRMKSSIVLQVASYKRRSARSKRQRNLGAFMLGKTSSAHFVSSLPSCLQMALFNDPR